MNREIPIVADDYVRDWTSAPAAVKMTPAHDPNDFEVGLRHNLEVIRVINDDGTINENGGKYNGMDRYECRKAIVEDLEEQGYLVKTEPYSHNVGTCYRCHNDVEPLISAQWFVKMEPLAKEAIRVVKDGDASSLCRSALPKPISTGWRTSMTGASPVSCGGATRSPHGTATSADTSTSAVRIPPGAKSAAAPT